MHGTYVITNYFLKHAIKIVFPVLKQEDTNVIFSHIMVINYYVIIFFTYHFLRKKIYITFINDQI